MSALSRADAPGIGRVFRLAWPMTIKALLLHGATVIDTYLVSPLGETALAAMGLAAAIAGFALGAILAFSNAMQIRTAQVSGAGVARSIKSVLAAGLAINFAIGFIGILFVTLAGRVLIDILGPSGAVNDLAFGYLGVFAVVILFESLSQCIAGYLNGRGRTTVPLMGFCLSVPVNVAASVALIHGLAGLPALGLIGAAIGSAIGAAVQFAFVGAHLWRHDRWLASVPGWTDGNFKSAFLRQLRFALPIGATFASANFASQVCALFYAQLDLNSFAALTVINPWIMVAGTVSMQWAQATGIVVAQLLGEKRPEQVLDAFLSRAWRAAFVTAAVVSVLYAFVCLSSDWLYRALDAQTRQILLGFLPILVVLPFPKGSNAICGNTLRASGDTVYVMHVFVWSQWLFRVPATAAAVLWLDLPATGILSIQLLEEIIKFLPFHRRLWCGDWKRANLED
ncbi:Na+-driven multidrug efflux pump [Albidovulum inexpectatum]|uniref:Na+-driven multidrug efflux pump n=1 Tax=Albidovulum inexpectatum TaxID=196587 RepID=A0A2S5JHQ8_9RHOB|nr:MATE family efflux transporter [Albidovulum inexpectatum]PPB80825.1 Na+-driven multidrug efflux pump [Albidovulum inexpectatum]